MEHSIYTYCYKRYGETGGGWGYYSYSDGMKRLFDHSNVLREFAGAAGYELAKNRDTWLTLQMTDYEKDIENERILIERYQPEKFAYQKIEIDGKETAVFTYARNLGREIIAENRAANKLVYTLAGDSSEVQDYPCFYYGNPYFQTLTRAYFKESDQTSCATPLQSVEIKNYKSITKETVHNFLSAEPERPDVLVNLFYTLIQEHSGRKRPIIICDQKDNIPLWIAAVVLLFPKEIAKEIFFSTYEFLGSEIGAIQIPEAFHLVGVYSPTVNGAPEAESTNYDISLLENNDEIVIFDLECGILPSVQKDGFAGLIYDFCKGNEKSLREYQQYIMNATNYRDFGTQYTAFYPTDKQKTELFPYYTKEVQQVMFDESYPLLFDAQTIEVDLNAAMYLVKQALQAEIISKSVIEEDVEAFAHSTLVYPTDDFMHLRKLEPIIQLLEKDVRCVVKEQIVKNSAEVASMLSKPSVTLEKLTYLISLFDPYQPGELQWIGQICNKMCECVEGKKIVTTHVENWIETGFNKNRPMYTPMLILSLLDLAKNDECISSVAIYSQTWEQQYQLEAFKHFEQSSYAVSFFRTLMHQLWNGTDPYTDVYHTALLLSTINSRLAAEWKQQWMYQLKMTDITNRKRIVERCMLNPEYRYNIEMEQQIQQIFQSYSFRDMDEIAQFAYVFCFRKEVPANKEYPVEWVATAISRYGYQKKAWKKAVDSVPGMNIPKQMDSIIRRRLMDDIHESLGTSQKGLFQKLLGKK